MQTTLNSFDILNRTKLKIHVSANPLHFVMDDLFVMGARNNPKRSFLFISKLLGKHLDVDPQIPKLVGHLLANMFTHQMYGVYYSNVEQLTQAIRSPLAMAKSATELDKRFRLSESILFIGFAETATGLGHGVFSGFENAFYVHTTREKFQDRRSVFDFEEEHSHATSHFCYLSNPGVLDEVEHIVLIDDEITTGNTCLNLIESIHRRHPAKQYTILSLLDWRNERQEAIYLDFMREFKVEINTISLVKGELVFDAHGNTPCEQPYLSEHVGLQTTHRFRVVETLMKQRVQTRSDEVNFRDLALYTGRFGLATTEHDNLERECKAIGESLGAIRKQEKTLCIGSGELIYLPSRIASYMGPGVFFKSSTRSPIHVSDAEDYPIYDKIEYCLEPAVMNYLYNLRDSPYTEIFMFFERFAKTEILEKIFSELTGRGIHHVTFVMI